MRTCLILILLATCASAEYRVALVVGSAAETHTATTELETLGFRCENSPNLNEKELRRKLESWATSTPINSTALVYFSGMKAFRCMTRSAPFHRYHRNRR